MELFNKNKAEIINNLIDENFSFENIMAFATHSLHCDEELNGHYQKKYKNLLKETKTKIIKVINEN